MNSIVEIHYPYVITQEQGVEVFVYTVYLAEEEQYCSSELEQARKFCRDRVARATAMLLLDDYEALHFAIRQLSPIDQGRALKNLYHVIRRCASIQHVDRWNRRGIEWVKRVALILFQHE